MLISLPKAGKSPLPGKKMANCLESVLNTALMAPSGTANLSSHALITQQAISLPPITQVIQLVKSGDTLQKDCFNRRRKLPLMPIKVFCKTQAAGFYCPET